MFVVACKLSLRVRFHLRHQAKSCLSHTPSQVRSYMSRSHIFVEKISSVYHVKLILCFVALSFDFGGAVVWENVFGCGTPVFQDPVVCGPQCFVPPTSIKSRAVAINDTHALLCGGTTPWDEETVIYNATVPYVDQCWIWSSIQRQFVHTWRARNILSFEPLLFNINGRISHWTGAHTSATGGPPALYRFDQTSSTWQYPQNQL